MAQPPTPRYHETAAAHIRELSRLSAKLPTLIATSAITTSQLTNAPIHPPSLPTSPNAPDTPARRRAALHATTNAFFSTVIELGTALSAQVEDLERLKVIPADDVKYVGAQPQANQQQGDEAAQPRDREASVKNAGLGQFDVGHLNARAGAGREDGEDVLKRVKLLFEEMVKEMEGEGEKEDEEMVDG